MLGFTTLADVKASSLVIGRCSEIASSWEYPWLLQADSEMSFLWESLGNSVKRDRGNNIPSAFQLPTYLLRKTMPMGFLSQGQV